MRQFFKFMFASMVGFVLAVGLIIGIFAVIVGVAVTSLTKDKDVSVSKNSLLEITLDYPLSERTSNDPFKNFNFSSPMSNSDIGLNDVLKDIAHAKTDNDIKGVFLRLASFHTGLATLEEIRNALLDFKKSGKFIYAYSDEYTQGSYYLSSVADKVYLNPEGEMELKGFAVEEPFFKGTLEKLGIEPEVIRHGKFKSAVEPFILDKMSDANREQTQKYVGDLWSHYLTSISSSRNIEKKELQKIADEYSIRAPEDAVTHKLVDKLAYLDEVQNDVRSKMGLKGDEKIPSIELKKYDRSVSKVGNYSFKKIAVIYAVGDIVSGKGDEETIGSEKLSETIRKARKDSSIKAIVLRVNSPGGSALASEVIWREMNLARKAKPVVVSMGDVAASGGYYISCAADTIVAEPNTITGSIGVFGLLFNTKKLFNDKLGINFDTVKTGRYADIGNSTRPITPEETNIIQREIERVYGTFLQHVSEGRHIDVAMVDSIAQGRVWSGSDAKALHLVDVIGGIDDAIAIAARMAKLEKYRAIELPEQKENFLRQFIDNFSDDSQASILKKELGDNYEYVKQLTHIKNMKGIRAELLYHFETE